MKVALVIAGSDPTGGAGIELDARVLRHFRVHALTVATALTVQDSARVHATHAVAAEIVRGRLDVLRDEVRPDVVKVGMLATAEIVGAVVDFLTARCAGIPLVVDPIVRASSGAELLTKDGVMLLRDRLMPRATVLTPNLAEARLLRGGPDGAAAGGRELSRKLLDLGADSVVVTGGDEIGAFATDWFATSDRSLALTCDPVPGASPHGTGCAFASAIAGALAQGSSPLQAVLNAKETVTRAIRRARPLPTDVRPLEGRRSLLFLEGD